MVISFMCQISCRLVLEYPVWLLRKWKRELVWYMHILDFLIEIGDGGL